MYDVTSISVVPSSWEEPFGRTAMEAASRGCATIISKRGGLVETVSNAIYLREITESELFNKIDYLIKKKNARKLIQLQSFKKVLHKLDSNTKKIDSYRNEIFGNSVFYVKKNKNLKIIHVSNFGDRLFNRLYFISIAKKLTNGFIRLGHDVTNVSDRDIIRFNRYLSAKSGVEYLNKLFFSNGTKL